MSDYVLTCAFLNAFGKVIEVDERITFFETFAVFEITDLGCLGVGQKVEYRITSDRRGVSGI